MKAVSTPAARPNGRRAFTLVEILVVVGVVCLLAAITFPIVNRVRATGRRTTCISNLRQLGIAMGQYAQDHYSFYPLVDVNAIDNSNTCAPWADALFPYVKSPQVFECPSNPYGAYRSDCPPDDTSDDKHPIKWSGSYDLNINYGRIYKPPGAEIVMNFKFRTLMSSTRYTRPSSTILLLDGDGSFVNPGFRPRDTQEHSIPDVTDLQYYGVPDRHEGGANVCFADGHAKWMSLESLTKSSLWRLNGPE